MIYIRHDAKRRDAVVNKGKDITLKRPIEEPDKNDNSYSVGECLGIYLELLFKQSLSSKRTSAILLASKCI